jgi:hypothetical protein
MGVTRTPGKENNRKAARVQATARGDASAKDRKAADKKKTIHGIAVQDRPSGRHTLSLAADGFCADKDD